MPNVIIQCQRSNPAKAPGNPCGAAHSRGVAQPGRAPGSGPGGRRFKSSLPDQSFQTLKLHFWFSVYIYGVDFVDGACIADFKQVSLANPRLIFLKGPMHCTRNGFSGRRVGQCPSHSRIGDETSLKDTVSSSPEARNAVCKSAITVFQDCNSTLLRIPRSENQRPIKFN